MTNKEIFIKSIQEEIDNGMELPDEAIAYFEELKNQLSEDYYLSNRLCNALEYGVPQDRDRIFLIHIHH